MDYNFVFQIIDAIGEISVAALVYFLWMDVKLVKYQTEHEYRPWIGPSSGVEIMDTSSDDKQKFALMIKNYGTLPASNVAVFFTCKNTVLLKGNLQSSDASKFDLGPLMPGMEKRYWFSVDSDLLLKAKEGREQVHVGLYFSYDYGKVKSGYGMISHFDSETGSFVHKEMWVD